MPKYTILDLENHLHNVQQDIAVLTALVDGATMHTYNQHLSVAPEECYEEVGELSPQTRYALRNAIGALIARKKSLELAMSALRESMQALTIEIDDKGDVFDVTV